jgi:translation initiation factor 1
MADLVYSSDGGDHRKRGRDRTATPAATGRPKVRRETSGRRGKEVTTVSNLPLDDASLKQLATKLKKRCGVGGSAKNGVIELQGDHRDTVMATLAEAGYDPVLAGG